MTRERPTRGPQQAAQVKKLLSDIRRGVLDESLAEIQQALYDRQKDRQSAVLQLVQEVYGPGYTITGTRTSRSMTPEEQSTGVVEPEKTPSTVLDGDDSDPDIESRSPIIGPYNG